MRWVNSAFAMLSAAATVAALSASAPVRPIALRAGVVPGTAQLHAFGGRSLAQRQSTGGRKLDAALADLTSHASLVRPGHVLADLHSLSPAARFKASASGEPLVAIDAVTRGDPQKLKQALVSLGLTGAAVYSNDVGGWLPVSQIDAATARAEVHSIRAALSRTRTGAVTSQGDFAQRSDVVRTSYPTLTGTGVTVGVLSDSFNCYAVYAANGVPASGLNGYAFNGFTADYADDVASGDLPSNVNVLEEVNEPSNGGCLNYGAPQQLPFTDEGRAMLQIVHDVAPGASLAFYTADNSEADFANGIGALATAGAKVIADDVGYFDEPFFQDGIVAQAIDTVEAQGVAYFSAAGNDGVNAYDNTAPSFTTKATTAPNSGEFLLNFDTTGHTNTVSLPITIPALYPGEYIGVVVEWDQPYVTGAPSSGGATSQIDLCIIASGSDTIIDLDGNPETCTGPNATGVDPVQVLIIGNPASASGNTVAENMNVQIGVVSSATAPGRIKLSVEDDGAGATINSFATNSPTIQGHPGAAGAAAVGAAFFPFTPRCGATPATLESFSSQGGTPILFDSTGTRLATPVVRQKPNFVGPDGVNNTFLGFTLASANPPIPDPSSVAGCANDASYPNFFGTSAATPHAASIAALMIQANSGVTPTQIYSALQSTALSMNGTAQPDYNSGYGFIQADAALATLVPGAPTISLSPTSVAVAGSSTLTWSASPIASSCTGSGAWTGAQKTSGSMTITPTATGTQTYTLTCADAAGNSVAGSATLTVTAQIVGATQPPPKSGGGSLDELTLLALAGLGFARLWRARREV
jgi:hypothetical protein